MPEEAMNFGHNGNIDHANRYERAGEYLDVVNALWDSIDDDAILLDRDSGLFADPARIRRINHDGKYPEGPRSAERAAPSPGPSLIVQAGSSDDGKTLKPRATPMCISPSSGRSRKAPEIPRRLRRPADGGRPRAQQTSRSCRAFTLSSRHRAAKPAKRRSSSRRSSPSALASTWFRAGAGSTCRPSRSTVPLPPLPDLETYDGQRSNLERMKAFAAQGLSIRDVAHRLINAGAVPSVIGTPTDVADQLEAWFTAGAADGFNLMFPLLPEDLTQFCTQVVPELQRRGLAQTDYNGATLRDRLGLRRPANRFGRT